MKKLMIAAAAAAMVSGAFADETAEPAVATKYNLITNTTLQISQVLQYKTKAESWKNINLDGDKKKFGKAVKYTDLAVDGVFYYDGKKSQWVTFSWNKEMKPEMLPCVAPAFDIFENNDKNKAFAVYGGLWSDGWMETVDETGKFNGGAEVTGAYGSLKYASVKDADNKKVKVLDLMVKSLKSVHGYEKYTVKSFKDKGSKSAQAQVDDYVKKLWDKAVKASKNAK